MGTIGFTYRGHWCKKLVMKSTDSSVIGHRHTWHSGHCEYRWYSGQWRLGTRSWQHNILKNMKNIEYKNIILIYKKKKQVNKKKKSVTNQLWEISLQLYDINLIESWPQLNEFLCPVSKHLGIYWQHLAWVWKEHLSHILAYSLNVFQVCLQISEFQKKMYK